MYRTNWGRFLYHRPYTTSTPPTISSFFLFSLNASHPSWPSSCQKAHVSPTSMLGGQPSEIRFAWLILEILNVLTALLISLWFNMENSHNMTLRSWAPGSVLWGLLAVSAHLSDQGPLWANTVNSLSYHTRFTPTGSTYPLHLSLFHAIRIQWPSEIHSSWLAV